jgi:cytochrome c oxidase subunit 2
MGGGNIMQRRLFYGMPLAIVLTVFIVFVGCNSTSDQESGEGSFSSNGQRIYFTATSSSGEAIIPEGFTMMMHRITCADCHGPKGKGGTVYMMMQSFDVPDISWSELTEQEHEDGDHEDHPPYTEETLKQAITQGLDPAGDTLDEFMPRWQMSEQDLNDLVGFIKTLK